MSSAEAHPPVGAAAAEAIGIVGYGAMGQVFGELLGEAGLTGVVCEPLEQARREAEQTGFELAANVSELASKVGERAPGRAIVAIVVRDDKEVLDVALGREGVLAGATRGTTLVLHSTIHPTTVRRVADDARQLGVAVLEAPVVGRPHVVRARQGIFLLGGDQEAIMRAEPYIGHLGQRSLVAGPLGAGSVAKLMRNLLLGGERLLLHEILRLGEAYGIDYVSGLEALREMQLDEQPLLERWRDAFDPSGASSAPYAGPNIHLYNKDMPLALKLAQEAGASLPITEQAVAVGLRLSAPDEQQSRRSSP